MANSFRMLRFPTRDKLRSRSYCCNRAFASTLINAIFALKTARNPTFFLKFFCVAAIPCWRNRSALYSALFAATSRFAPCHIIFGDLHWMMFGYGWLLSCRPRLFAPNEVFQSRSWQERQGLVIPDSLFSPFREASMAEPDNHFTKLLHSYIEQKDERAVEEIVLHYGPILRHIVKHRLENWRYFNREDIRDVEQDAWKSIFRLVLDGVDLDDLDNDAKLTALIKLIAERKAAKLLRAQVHTAKRDVRRLIQLDGAASRLTRILVDPQVGPAKRAELVA
jgi:hypothetical protein